MSYEMDAFLRDQNASVDDLIDGKYLFLEPNMFVWESNGTLLTLYTPMPSDGEWHNDSPSDMVRFAEIREINLQDTNAVEDIIDETITIYQEIGESIIFDSIDDMLNFIAMSGHFRAEIVRVEVLDERTELFNANSIWQHEDAQYFLGEDRVWEHSDNYEPVTINRVRVLDVFMGDVQVGDILEVRQSGGHVGNMRLICSAFLPLMSGDDLVLFLASFAWMPNSPASMITNRQAAYRFPALDNGNISFHMDESLDSLYQFPEHMAEYGFSLTFEDLANFQIENFGQISESFGAILS